MFDKINGGGKDIILDFEDGKDKINLSSYRISGSEVTSKDDFTITQKGGDVEITLANGDEMLIRNSNATDFSNHDFIF